MIPGKLVSPGLRLGIAGLAAVFVLLNFALPSPREASASNVTQVATGAYHSCALLGTGAVKCWGSNGSGQLGDGTTTQRNTPVSVCATGTWNGSTCAGGSALTGITRISGGANHTCALTSGGGVKCWGDNSEGALGDGTTTSPRLNPVDVCITGSGAGCGGGSALTGVLRVSVGGYHSCALTTTFGVKCWGHNFYGQLGDGTIATPRLNPVDVCATGSGAGCGGGSALAGVSQVTSGNIHTCALVSAGVKCWGSDLFGNLGNGSPLTDAANPIDVGNNSIVSADTSGDVGRHTSLAIDASGFPVVSYHDTANGDLKLLRCTARSCRGANSIVSPDTTGVVGTYTSLALDASGFPVVSYVDVTNGALKLLHCGNASCTAGNSITSPDVLGTPVLYTSLRLDASGFPVVSYFDNTGGNLKVLHCGNANCTAGNSIASPDTTGIVGADNSLALDTSGFPVVSYLDSDNVDLKVLHCGNANCTAGNTINSPDTTGSVGTWTSIQLDSFGFPVVSYRDETNLDLKVMHCNDANCSGGNENINSPDTAGSVGAHTSLALDAAGFPVVSYRDTTNLDLKVVHCNDADCAGSNETFESPDTGGDVGTYSSLELDGNGFPVISYLDDTNDDLKVARCGDANCSALLAGASFVDAGDTHTCAVVTAGRVRCWGGNAGGGLGDGNIGAQSDAPVPVCADSACATPLTGAIFVAAGGYHSCAPMPGNTSKCWGMNGAGQLADGGAPNSSGTPRNVCGDDACSAPISNLAAGGGDLGIEHSCAITMDGNVACAGDNFSGQLGDGNAPTDRDTGPGLVTGLDTKDGASPINPDTSGIVGRYTSLVLDSLGNPVVSYYDVTNGDLKVLHCGNANCSSGNTIASPDTGGDVGTYTSIELDGSGNPVVSYLDVTNLDLKLLVCGNSTCTAGNSLTAVDTGGFVGRNSSLELDGGIPVIAYEDFTNSDLKVVRCGNAACTAGNTFETPYTNPHALDGSISMALDGSIPVISFFRLVGEDLIVIRCGDSTCTAGNSVEAPDTTGSVGRYNSIAIDGSGSPVVSYLGANSDLKVLHCGDTTCSSGNVFASVDSSGVYTSVALDSSGNPVVSYSDGGSGTLKLLHCGNAYCTGGNTIATLGAGSSDEHTSLQLDSSGFPVISYYDGASGDLAVLHCNDASCSGADAPPPVTAFLGTGTDGDCASGPATTCAIDGPHGMFSYGQITFLADGDNCRVKWVEDGMVTTVAGLGPTNCGYDSNTQADLAKLNHPNDVFLDATFPNLDLYIADTDNCRIRKVDLLGTPTISTVAGLACDGTSVDGAVGVATFNKPAGVAFVGGALYVAERDGCKIRKVQGGTVSTVAGTGTCGFGGDSGQATNALLDHPTDVAPMRPGFGLLIADRDNHRIRYMHLLSGVITTIAGSGPDDAGAFSGDGGAASSARLNGPEAVDSADGQVLIADTQNDRIRIVNTFTNTIRTFMGAGGLIDSVSLNEPRSVSTTGIGIAIAGEEGEAAASEPGAVKAGFVRACSFTNPTLCYQGTIGGMSAYGDRTFTSVPTTSCSFVPGAAGTIDVGLPLMLVGLLAFRKRIKTFFIRLRATIAPLDQLPSRGGLT